MRASRLWQGKEGTQHLGHFDKEITTDFQFLGFKYFPFQLKWHLVVWCVQLPYVKLSIFKPNLGLIPNSPWLYEVPRNIVSL
jgi:hypothetical protein